MDVELLLDNAIKFYSPEVQEHKDALQLKQVYEDAKARLCDENDEGTVQYIVIFLPHNLWMVHHVLLCEVPGASCLHLLFGT